MDLFFLGIILAIIFIAIINYVFFYDRKKFRYRKNVPAEKSSGIPDDLVNARLSRRIAAFMIDGIMFFFIIMGMIVAGAIVNLDSNTIAVLLIVAFYPVVILYFALFDAGLGKLNATPGKKLLSIVVVDRQFQQLSFRSSLKRALLKVTILTLFMITFILGLSNYIPGIFPVIFAFLLFPPLSFPEIFSRSIPAIWDRILKTKVVLDPGKEWINHPGS
jgi:hypothetical protein